MSRKRKIAIGAVVLVVLAVAVSSLGGGGGDEVGVRVEDVARLAAVRARYGLGNAPYLLTVP